MKKSHFNSERHWSENESGELCKAFADFVESWEPEKTVIKGSADISSNIEIYNMTADGIPFSFRRVGVKYSLIYDGRSEIITQSTYDFWVQAFQKLFKEWERIERQFDAVE